MSRLSPRRLLAEFIGTAFLLAGVVGSGIMAQNLSTDVGLQLFQNAFATAGILVALILALGPASGAHFNPAVTLADRALGGIDTPHTIGYIAAQILGGALGVMAANLMYIKSRTLLPRHEQPPGEDIEEEDPRWELIRQLVEYKKFKDAAGYLEEREAEQQRIFAGMSEDCDPEEEESVPLPDVGIFDLILAFQGILKRFEDKDKFDGDIYTRLVYLQ